MRDSQVKWLCLLGCIFMMCMGLETAYEHYLDHAMPIEQTKILKK